jgi:hypothetical protein
MALAQFQLGYADTVGAVHRQWALPFFGVGGTRVVIVISYVPNGIWLQVKLLLAMVVTVPIPIILSQSNVWWTLQFKSRLNPR